MLDAELAKLLGLAKRKPAAAERGKTSAKVH
jgi:hypothetical protein